MVTKFPNTIKQVSQLYKSRQLRVSDMIDKTYQQIQDKSRLNAFVTVQERAKLDQQINESQERHEKGNQLSELDGVPIAIKDNILVKELPSTAASRILQNFTPQVDATVIKKLKAAGAIIVGKTNMDEFGMGSLGTYGYDQKKIVRNPIDSDYIAGGSSSGSAAATKSQQSVVSLGTDTGGSVSYPAHCCGLYSMKPSYGRLSRYGQILYSSSNDVIGPMTNSAEDLEVMFNIMQGQDSNDSNCIDFSKIHNIRDQNRITNSDYSIDNKQLRVGIVREFDIEELDDRNRNIQNTLQDIFKDKEIKMVDISIPLIKYALPFYFTLVPSEASSNLSRYDGLKYGYQIPIGLKENQSQKQDLYDYIERIRSEAFGLNVKRRVLLGNFLLSSRFSDFNEKVIEAQKVRRLLIDQYCKTFEQNNLDFIISPVSIGIEPPKIDEVLNSSNSATKNPVYEYKMDYYTALPNSLGIPAITLPVHEDRPKYKFPSSFMLQGYFGEDYHLLKIAKLIDKELSARNINVNQ